jgi:hypothetical protein
LAFSKLNILQTKLSFQYIEARKKIPKNGKDTQKILSLETGGIAAKQFVTPFAFISAFYLFSLYRPNVERKRTGEDQKFQWWAIRKTS